MNKSEILDLIVENVKCNGLSQKDAIAKFLLEKKISLMFFPDLEILFPEFPISEEYEISYGERKRRMVVQERELDCINATLIKAGIEFMIVKGMPLSKILTDNPFARECSDIDILVKKEDMLNCYRALSSCGYRFWEGVSEYGELLVSDSPDYLFAADYHEFQCVKFLGDNSYNVIEIKYATSAVPYKYIKSFWDNAININVGNVLVRTFSYLDTLVHIIAHLYVNSQCEDGYVSTKFFRDIIDLKIFLDVYADIDWDYIFRKAHECEMVHQVYFALNAINSMWQNTVNAETVAMFCLDRVDYACKCNEQGELWNWKSDIKTRCFNEELRVREYGLLYKECLFDESGGKKNSEVEGGGELFNQGEVEYFVGIDYDSMCKKVHLFLIYNEETFREKKIYFTISVIDNNRDQALVERSVSNSDVIKWNGLLGQWDHYVYNGNGIERICINVDNIFANNCNKISVLIDSFERVGKNGFRGTGTKGSVIISD